MALRALGVYALAGTALHAQTRTAVHVSRMRALAADAAAIALAAEAATVRAAALRAEAAREAAAGLEAQAEAAELELDAEAERVRAAAETARGAGYAERAEALHERSAEDGLAAANAVAAAEEMELRAAELQARTETDRLAAAADEEKSVAFAEKAAKAGTRATEAEERAAEYEIIVIEKEGLSARDGEAALRTEAGALEDVEVMAACAPIPLVNLFCDAVGAILESGAQGLAAFEAATSGLAALSAAAAQRKEQAKLAVALEQQGEAARLAAEADEYQGLAAEARARAATEAGESKAARAKAGEEELLGEEKSGESEQEEARAAFDEEKAEEHYAKAARDQSLASEEEALAAADQLESEELLSESTGEEFEALSAQADGEGTGAEAERVLKQSVGHGVHAFGWMLHAVVTAGLVVYVVVMRGMTQILAPALTAVFARAPSLRAAHVVEYVGGCIMHATVVLGTIASMLTLMSSSKPMPPKALLQLALVAGLIEALGVHSTCAACRCHAQGVALGPAVATTVRAFLTKLLHLVPVVLMELLILTIVFGREVFDTRFLSMHPVGIWGGLVLMVSTFVMHSRTLKTQDAPDQSSTGDAEHHCSFKSVGQQSMRQEYGSMEEVSLLSLNSSSLTEGAQTYDANMPNYLRRCVKAFYRYCDGLRPASDLLILSLLAMLLWHCWPLLRVLHPLAKTSLGLVTSWVSMPIFTVAVFILAVMVHFLLVR